MEQRKQRKEALVQDGTNSNKRLKVISHNDDYRFQQTNKGSVAQAGEAGAHIIETVGRYLATSFSTLVH